MGHSHAMADVLPIRTASAVNHELSLSDGGAEAAVRSSCIVKTTLLAVVYAREAFLVHLDMPCTMTIMSGGRATKMAKTARQGSASGTAPMYWHDRLEHIGGC